MSDESAQMDFDCRSKASPEIRGLAARRYREGRKMTDLIVDLSQVKVGDTVVFRNGGRMPIGYIESFEVESHNETNTGYFLRVGESPYSEIIGRFSRNGINERHPYQNAYCEIVAVEKAQ